MNLIEKFAIGNSGWGNAFSFSSGGDDVDMKIEDIILYTFLPFGEIFLRINKLNGSFHRMYLFILSLIGDIMFWYSILDIYEQNYGRNVLVFGILIPAILRLPTALLTYYEKMSKVDDNQGNVIDAPILIPLILRFLFGFGMLYLERLFGNRWSPIITNILLFLTIMFAMFIRLALRRQCKSSDMNKYAWKRFIKIFFDALFIYGIIFIMSGIILGLQGDRWERLFNREIPYYGNMKDFITMIAWILGALGGYAINNMIDINFNTKFEPPYNNDDLCTGTISDLRYVIATIVFVVGAIIYTNYSSYNQMDPFNQIPITPNPMYEPSMQNNPIYEQPVASNYQSSNTPPYNANAGQYMEIGP
jgi:hypothetical protein